jgi:hypothetical protein
MPGVVIGMGSMLLAGGDPAALLNAPAAVSVFGDTLGLTSLDAAGTLGPRSGCIAVAAQQSRKVTSNQMKLDDLLWTRLRV